jgi:hypothetical protein
LKAAKILIPYEQSVKWSTLVAGEEDHDSDFAQTENNENQEHFESRPKVKLSVRTFSKKVVVSRKNVDLTNF